MIEYLVVRWLCKKNSQEALERGHRPIGYAFLTAGLWFGMEIIGLIIGFAAEAEVASYVLGIVFAAIGGFISHTIVNHLKQGDYTPKVKAQPLAVPSQITVTRQENSALNVFGVWDIYLNGANIGTILDGAQITVSTGQRNNTLTAKDSSGNISRPFEFFAQDGGHSHVIFKAGWFVNAQGTNTLFSAGQGQSAVQGTPQ